MDSPIKYDTMTGIKIDQTLTPETWQSSEEYRDSHGKLQNGANQSEANTGDETKTVFLWLLSLSSLLGDALASYMGEARKKKNMGNKNDVKPSYRDIS